MPGWLVLQHFQHKKGYIVPCEK